METKPKLSSKSAYLALAAILIVLFPLGYSVASSLFSQGADPSGLFLERPDAVHESCVRETEFMRFHHWELLRGIREEVVRYGIRGEVGLHNCRDCHESRERFCNRCHEAVSLFPDCFDCHYYP
jgi:hypothetical protein